MRAPQSVRSLEELGRVRLSASFFMRDFLYSEIANFYGLSNLPEDPDLMITAGRKLCEILLEPLRASFGGLAIRSGYRSASLNNFGNSRGLNCASNERNRAGHIWDQRDRSGKIGARACIVIPWFADRYAKGADWRGLAWWIHDHLDYSELQFFPKLAAFNITWNEIPKRRITSYVPPKGLLSKPGSPGHDSDHQDWYRGFPPLKNSADILAH